MVSINNDPDNVVAVLNEEVSCDWHKDETDLAEARAKKRAKILFGETAYLFPVNNTWKLKPDGKSISQVILNKHSFGERPAHIF